MTVSKGKGKGKVHPTGHEGPEGEQRCSSTLFFNPLNAELNPIRYFLALLGAHHILHVSRIKVNLGAYWIILVQDRDKWRAVLKRLMNIGLRAMLRIS